MKSPKDVLSAILDDPTNPQHVAELTTPDVTYVSLNFSNPDLRRIMPWCGTHQGPQHIVQTFVDVGRYWESLAFVTDAVFGDQQHAAMFGSMTYRSKQLGKEVTSPFAVFAKVANGRCHHLQFMEDTFATGASFRQGGTWTFQSNPNGETVTI